MSAISSCQIMYCILTHDGKACGIHEKFMDAVASAEHWARSCPGDAPFCVERREKLWFSDVPVRVLIEARSRSGDASDTHRRNAQRVEPERRPAPQAAPPAAFGRGRPVSP